MSSGAFAKCIEFEASFVCVPVVGGFERIIFESGGRRIGSALQMVVGFQISLLAKEIRKTAAYTDRRILAAFYRQEACELALRRI